MFVCEWCKTEFIPKRKQKRTPRFCSRACVNAGQAGSGNPAYGKTYRTKKTHPEWAARVSATSSARHINAGDVNGMGSYVLLEEIRKFEPIEHDQIAFRCLISHSKTETAVATNEPTAGDVSKIIDSVRSRELVRLSGAVD